VLPLRVLVDFETTGLSTKRDKIIQFAALKVYKGEVIGDLNLFLNPNGTKIGSGAFAAHGITQEFLNDKPEFSEIKDQVDRFFEGVHLLIAYNSRFEQGFLIQYYDKKIQNYLLNYMSVSL